MSPDEVMPDGGPITDEEQRVIDDLKARLEEFRVELAAIEEEALKDDATIDLSIEEIAVLAEAGAVEPPAPVRWEVSNLSAQPGWSVRVETARRGLIARHLLDADGVPAPALVRMLELFDQPVLVGRVEFTFGANTYEFDLCADDESAGEAVALATGLYRFSVFPLAEFTSRLIVRSGLMERPHEDGAFSLETAQFIDLVDAALEGDDPVDLLHDRAGVPRDLADRYVAATRERISSAAVTVLACTAPGVLEGGSMTWLDGGPHGLWRLPDVEDQEEAVLDRLEIRAVQAASLLDELGSYLGLELESA